MQRPNLVYPRHQAVQVLLAPRTPAATLGGIRELLCFRGLGAGGLLMLGARGVVRGAGARGVVRGAWADTPNSKKGLFRR